MLFSNIMEQSTTIKYKCGVVPPIGTIRQFLSRHSETAWECRKERSRQDRCRSVVPVGEWADQQEGWGKQGEATGSLKICSRILQPTRDTTHLPIETSQNPRIFKTSFLKSGTLCPWLMFWHFSCCLWPQKDDKPMIPGRPLNIIASKLKEIQFK